MIWFIYLVLSIVSQLYSGLVLSVMWGWFIVPLGIAAITIPHAVGISFITGFFLGGLAIKDAVRDQNNKSLDMENQMKIVMASVVYVTIIFFNAFIYKQFM